MQRILFFAGTRFPIYSYGVFLMLSIVVSIVLVLIRRKKLGLSADDALGVVSGFAIWGLIGGRLLHVLLTLPEYVQHPLEIFNFRGGGLALYGAIVGGLSSMAWFSYRHKVPLLSLFDLGGVAGIVAQAVGRIGCFLNGCCYGKEASYTTGVIFKDAEPDVRAFPRYPTQIYEAVGDILIFLILVYFERHQRFRGQIFVLYITLYAALRFTVEFWRDEPIVAMGLTFAQICSVFGVLAGVIILSIAHRRKDAPGPDSSSQGAVTSAPEANR